MPRGKNAPKKPAQVDSLKHKDKRANIPTEELRDFVADDEKTPKKMLYPRDPSLDPQLVWKGKDEQDTNPLEVPVVPIYVQEKIHPQVLIENLRETAKKGEPEPELTLFDDFNGIDFEELVDFYQHEQNWANRMILGDSLLVMTSLAEKEGLAFSGPFRPLIPEQAGHPIRSKPATDSGAIRPLFGTGRIRWPECRIRRPGCRNRTARRGSREERAFATLDNLRR